MFTGNILFKEAPVVSSCELSSIPFRRLVICWKYRDVYLIFCILVKIWTHVRDSNVDTCKLYKNRIV